MSNSSLKSVTDYAAEGATSGVYVVGTDPVHPDEEGRLAELGCELEETQLHPNPALLTLAVVTSHHCKFKMYGKIITVRFRDITRRLRDSDQLHPRTHRLHEFMAEEGIGVDISGRWSFDLSVRLFEGIKVRRSRTEKPERATTVRVFRTKDKGPWFVAPMN